MLLFICITLALLQFTQADTDITTKEANDYIDYILTGPFTQEKKYHDLKKLRMPNFSFHYKTDGKDIHVNMEDGTLTDANEIERFHDCVVENGDGETTAVSCTLVFVNMLVKYHIITDVTEDDDDYSGTAHMDVDFKGTEGRIKMEVDKKSRRSHLRKFDVHKQESTEMTTVLNDFTGDAEKALDKHIKRKILRKCEKEVRKVLRKLVKEIFESAIEKSPHRIKDSFRELKN